MINVNTVNADGEITEIMSRYNDNKVIPYDVSSLYPEIMKKTVSKIGVTVISTNDKRYEHNYIETDTLLSASRIMNTFKPKRGYRAISFKVEEVEVLV